MLTKQTTSNRRTIVRTFTKNHVRKKKSTVIMDQQSLLPQAVMLPLRQMR